jgi:hypothetical protein
MAAAGELAIDKLMNVKTHSGGSARPARPLAWSGILVLAALAATAPAAQASGWRLEKYVYGGTFLSETYGLQNRLYLERHTISHKRNAVSSDDTGDDNGEVAGNPEGGTFGSMTLFQVGGSNYAGTPGYPIVDPPGGETKSKFSVQAVLHWERDLIPDPDFVPPDPDDPWWDWEEWPMIEDPNDNPPDFVWVYERATIQAGRSNTHKSDADFDTYTAEDPYDGQDISLDALDVHFGGEGGHYSGVAHEHWGYVTVTDRMTGWHLFKMKTQGQDEVWLPKATFTGQLTAADVGYSNGRALSTSITADYEAFPPRFELQSRRRGANNFGTAAIAAGGKSGDEHLAELAVRVRHPWHQDPMYWEYGVQGISRDDLPDLEIVDPTGDAGEAEPDAHAPGVAAKLEDNPDPNPPAGSDVTDQYGRVVKKWLRSSDITTEYRSAGRVKVALQLDKPQYNPTHEVYQVWSDHNDWGTGADGHGPWLGSFSYEQPIRWTFRPAFGEGTPVPITGHTMKFLFSDVAVWELDETQQFYSLKYYTDNKNNRLYWDPWTPWEIKPEEDLTVYGSWDQPTTTGSNGSYSSTMTVPYDREKLVRWIQPMAEDQSALYPVDGK